MGRGKIEIEIIENSSSRQTTYTKRRNGLIKKATEISVLCDVEVALVIFSSTNVMHDYCSHPGKIVDILDKYQNKSGKCLWDTKHENLHKELERLKKENDSMRIKLSHFKGKDINSLTHRELAEIEEILENGLDNIREKKAELFDIIEKNQKLLDDENKRLRFYLNQLKSMDDNMGKMEGFGNAGRDYNPQMPFAFRVQPIQPNLQERI
uniref:PISTILLATA-like protein n=1 Tax=Balanophora laxiflora TaxID=1128103 RepID=K7R240_9MAGN|nr:PISTILLATA-like protein [Balanophora laxiflora]